MLLKIEVANFQAIRDRQTVDLRVPTTTPDDPKRFMPVRAEAVARVPKVAAFFGPNASGKTTFLKAITFAFEFALQSFHRNEPGSGIPVEPFASAPWRHQPTEIVVEFAPGPFINEAEPIYRYELIIDRDAETSYISWEALRRSGGGAKFRTLFERTGDKETSTVKPFEDLGLPRGDPRLSVRSNVSVISNLLQFDHDRSKQIFMDFRAFFGNANLGRLDQYTSSMTKYYEAKVGSVNNVDSLNKFIRNIDIGVERVYLETKNGIQVPMFVHKGLDIHQRYENESQGTRNFYCLFPMINLALMGGGTAVIDEIDSDIHPMLMPEIIRWFRSSRTNPYNAQLIMTCHTATLLEDLVKEEVWFADKDETGSTHLYGAKEIENVQRRTNIYAKYLGGAFGALPQVG